MSDEVIAEDSIESIVGRQEVEVTLIERADLGKFFGSCVEDDGRRGRWRTRAICSGKM